jgi:hypothetical protein
MKKSILILILFISFSSYSKTKTDTINNWQLYKDNKIIEGIKFHSISHINEVLDLILEK